jgi:hypothetical protein
MSVRSSTCDTEGPLDSTRPISPSAPRTGCPEVTPRLRPMLSSAMRLLLVEVEVSR